MARVPISKPCWSTEVRGVGDFGETAVRETCHGDVVGNADPFCLQGFHGPYGRQIVGAEDGIGEGSGSDQAVSFPPPFFKGVGFHVKSGIKRNPPLLQGIEITQVPFPSDQEAPGAAKWAIRCFPCAAR